VVPIAGKMTKAPAVNADSLFICQGKEPNDREEDDD